MSSAEENPGASDPELTKGELLCAVHQTPTRLRCAECDTGICPKCMVRTAVGLKCPEHAEGIAPKAPPPISRKSYPLIVLALLAVVGGLVAIALTLQGDEEASTPVTTPTGGTTGAELVLVPQVFIVGADGSGAHTVTSRALSFDGAPAFSPDGTQIAFDSVGTSRRAIYVVGVDGSSIRRLTDAQGSDSYPAWSPDGQTVAFMREEAGNFDVYVIGADGSGERRITDSDALDGYPAFTPNGSSITFVSERDGTLRLWSVGVEGSDPTLLSEVQVVAERPSWFPDGSRLAFTSDRDGGDPEIYTMAADGTDLVRITEREGIDGEAAVSPDGSAIAFASDRAGIPAVYVMDIDGSDVRKLTSGFLAVTPAWSPDGTEIAYVGDPSVPD